MSLVFTLALAAILHCINLVQSLILVLYKLYTLLGCGWPAFYDAIPGAINQTPDNSHGQTRIEITCAACNGHLGHVFKGEGFQTPTDQRVIKSTL